MRNPVQQPGLIAHRKALEAAGIAISLVMRVPAPLKSLADQVIRSASSVPANLSEGHGRSGRDRMHHWRIAYGSAKEVDTHLRLLTGAGAIDTAQAATAIQLFDEVRAGCQVRRCAGPSRASRPAARCAQCRTGHSTERAAVTASPGAEGGRRRAVSGVTVFPVSLDDHADGATLGRRRRTRRPGLKESGSTAATGTPKQRRGQRRHP